MTSYDFQISSLDRFLEQLSEKLPKLRYLSLLGNLACPDQLSSYDKNEKDYLKYRLEIILCFFFQ